MRLEPYQIRILGGGQFACPEGERVLIAMEQFGSSAIGVGCRGGGCGFCLVRVVEGEYRTGKMSTAKVSVADQAKVYALACRIYPMDDLVIEVL